MHRSKVFISYSRKDQEFVKELRQALDDNDLPAWVDWINIPYGADWWEQITKGILSSDIFVIVISPNSISSKVCQDEIKYALENNKRIIPILRKEPESEKPLLEIQVINWLFFRENDDFNSAVIDLITTIKTDLEWVEGHTRLLVKSYEWEENDRNIGYLLQGDDLIRSEEWLLNSLHKEPKSTDLQSIYIQQSRSQATRTEAEIQSKNLQINRTFKRTGIVHIGDEVTKSVWDGSSLWVACHDSDLRNDSLQQIDPEKGVVVPKVALDGGARDLLWNGSSLWTTGNVSRETTSVQQIDPEKGAIVAEIELDGISWDLLWGDSNLWVACHNHGIDPKNSNVQLIDPEKGVVVNKIELDGLHRDLLWDGSSLWVTCYTNWDSNYSVQKIDPEKGEIVAKIDLMSQVTPHVTAMEWGSNSVWVLNKDGIIQIDPDKGLVITKIELDDIPIDLLWNDKNIWVMCYGSVQQIDPLSGAIIANVKLETNESAAKMLWDGINIWVACSGETNSVQQIDIEKKAIVSKMEIDEVPSALLWDGSNIWLERQGAGIMQKIYLEKTSAIARTRLFDAPDKMVWGDGNIWGSSYEMPSGPFYVHQFDPKQDRQINQVELDDAPRAIVWDGNSIWVACCGETSSVEQIDPEREMVIAKVEFDNSSWDLDLIWDGNSIWVACEEAVKQIDPQLGVAIAEVELDGATNDLLWDGNSVWAACYDIDGEVGSVQRIDPGKGMVVAKIEVEGAARDLLWDGNSIWVACGDDERGTGSLVQIDPEKAVVVAKIELDSAARNLLRDGSSVWVACHNMYDEVGSVQQIDPKKSEIIAKIEIRGGLFTGEALAMEWDGNSVWVASKGGVLQIDPQMGMIIARIPTSGSSLLWNGKNLWTTTGSYLCEINTRSLNLLMLAKRKALINKRGNQ